jgi:outer membrane protein assembly factor BamB
VIVHPASKEAPRLVAFDAQSSAQVWASAAKGQDGYSSPQLSVLANVPQVLIYNGEGLFAHDPATGDELWNFPIKFDQTAPAVTQPMVLLGDKIVIGGGRIGIPSYCIQVTHGAEGWSAKEIWKSIKFSPGYNDFVQQGGFLYGLNAGSGKLVCIEAETGKERWRDGDYGGGQMLLAGDRLLVQAEDGHLALVKATPEAWQEVGMVPALSDKTWNHPVIANGRLFVRNGSELVCFQLGVLERGGQ